MDSSLCPMDHKTDTLTTAPLHLFMDDNTITAATFVVCHIIFFETYFVIVVLTNNMHPSLLIHSGGNKWLLHSRVMHCSTQSFDSL